MRITPIRKLRGKSLFPRCCFFFQSLEVGLSYNFEVRDHPIYHLITAKVQRERGEAREAVRTLQQAMKLLEEADRKKEKESPSTRCSKEKRELTHSFR